MKLVLSILFLLFSSWAQAKDEDCGSDVTNVICELSWSDKNVKFNMQAYKLGCEFPEGEMRSCLAFRLCVSGVRAEVGASTLFYGTDLDFLCQQKRPVELLGSAHPSRPSITTECIDKKSTNNFIFKTESKQKKCFIALKKVLK
jgi:hypothetical protein